MPGQGWTAFVDSIASSPTVRLQLDNDTPWRLLAEGTDLSPPPLSRAVAGTLLADGQVVPAAAYDNRVITLHLQMQGGTTLTDDAAATALQSLTRELDRTSNLLRWQPGAALTNPVFFRTLRSDLTDIDWDPLNKEATVRILAEPFGYGLKQSLTPVVVTNDPAAGSNGMFFDVTSPLGDVETPLFLAVDANDVTSTGRRQSIIAVRRRGTPSAAPFLLQAESMTLGTDTTLPGNDAAMSGTGSNYARCTFATATLLTRLSFTLFPASPSVDVRGNYRVYMRYRKSVGGDSIQVNLRADGDGITITNSSVTLAATDTSLHWADLGALQFPTGPDPVTDGYSNTTLAVRGYALAVQAARSSGAGNVDMDAFIFVPADDRMCLIKWSATSGPTSFIVDSAYGNVYAVRSVGEVAPATIAEVVGSLPMITPAQTNRIYFVQDVGTNGTVDSKTTVIDITPYYWPRYLYVRPATT